MLLGLAYHATYAWFPDVGPWYFVADGSPVPALPVLTGLLHAFRMQVFFALSGFLLYLPWLRSATEGGAPPRLKTYLLRRCLRIMPAYYETTGRTRVAPSFRDKTILSAEQIEDIVAYLMTLR